MLRERIPMLSAMTLDQLGARMKCDKCGKRSTGISLRGWRNDTLLAATCLRNSD